MQERISRRHPEKQADPSNDTRKNAQRDHDRLLYSIAFRRLAGVTQIVSPIEGDVVHNRLTHSLKVAQLGRRLSERLLHLSDPELLKAGGGLEPEIVEAAGLAHDLGHPPFGHIGETELDSCLQGESEEGYEGNAQSFRIVTKLAIHSIGHVGLNLTRASLNAILKYPWLKTEKDTSQAPDKWGAYEDEIKDFQWARITLSGATKSLEAQIMDWADDVTYAVHDVDDFFRAGLVPLHLLVRDPEEQVRFITATRERWQRKGYSFVKEIKAYEDSFRRLIQTWPIRGPYMGTQRERAVLKQIGSEPEESPLTT